MRYDRKVIVRELVRTEDEGGGYTETLEDVTEWWAKIEPLQGDEQIQAMQVGMQRPHRFTGHYRRGMSGATQLFYDNRSFNVRSVVDTDERHREHVVMADEEVAP